MNKEEIKEFLKPNFRKIILVLFLFFVSTIFSRQDNTFIPLANPDIAYETDGRNELIGFPLQYIDMSYNTRAGFNLNNSIYQINYFKLIIDLIFWYFASCTIIYLKSKFKK